MDKWIEYAPILIVVIVFFIQQRIFVTPEQLEKKHREIITEIEHKFTTIQDYENLKEQFENINEKLDKIYDILIKG